jgi:hypothetical protein
MAYDTTIYLDENSARMSQDAAMNSEQIIATTVHEM